MTRNELKQLIRETIEEVMGQQATGNFVVNGKQVDVSTIEIDGIDRRDYPDFSDAYISAAQYTDGTPLDDKAVEQLNNMAYGWVNSKIHDDQLYM
jgi:hypothetical protein